MRILQISSARALGGGERHLVDLASALAARGHQVYVALAPASPLREALAALPAENVFTVPLRNALDLASALKLAHFVRERRIEIVHAHLARDYPLAAFAAWRSFSTKLIITRHVLFPLGRVHSLTLSHVARVIAVSEPVRRALLERGLFPARKIRVVPNGIDVARFDLPARGFDREEYRRVLQTRAPFLVGTVGELSHVKGQEDFVRAAAIIARRQADGVEFIIAGEDASRAGHTRARIESLVAELNLRDRVHLLGRREDVAPLLSSLDVFVSPSRSEAFGLAIAEALACGTPAVATATDGAREIIDEGVTGRLVPVGDVEALAAAVLNLLKDPQGRRRMGAKAREAARSHFSLDRMVDATERIYREALDERNS
ncbi:MAG: glycosyltransferase family 4 protein [Acidobacteria bacterium]|nr:glycosyltransferase family 4 protein [Acidobacteriota bacterium]